MPYDRGLAQRVRDLLAEEQDITERAMFGGLALLVDGRMALAVGAGGEMMIRADAVTEGRLLERDGITHTTMRGRPVSGWLDVDGTLTADDDALTELVSGAISHARTLPATS